jgi:hypothetical protein
VCQFQGYTLAESFAYHFVHRRFHKPRRDWLTITIALPVIRDQGPVVHDVRAQLRQRLDQSRVPGIRLAERPHRTLQIVNLAQGFVHLTMPQRPFQTLDFLANRFSSHRLTCHQTFAVLAQHRELHREVIPVQDMDRLGTHLELELPQRVVTIGKKGNGLVHL